jgi:hypothetical protein
MNNEKVTNSRKKTKISIGTVIITTIIAATLLVISTTPQAYAQFVTPGTEHSGKTNEGKPHCSPHDVPPPCDPPPNQNQPGQFLPPNPPGDTVCTDNTSGKCKPPL